jgi:hypothetical protein
VRHFSQCEQSTAVYSENSLLGETRVGNYIRSLVSVMIYFCWWLPQEPIVFNDSAKRRGSHSTERWRPFRIRLKQEDF